MSAGDFENAQVGQQLTANVIPLSKNTNAVVGVTETLITNPDTSRFNRLLMHIDAAGFRFRVGDVRVLTWDAAVADTDVTNDRVNIAGIGARAYAAKGEGPFQVSGTLPTGLTTNLNYWIAINVDGNDADDVTFYLTQADALAATDIAVTADARVDITVVGVGTANFAGMANNGLAAAPAATVIDGYTSLHLVPQELSGSTTATPAFCYAAPSQMTVFGLAAGSVMYYWWAP